jgi:uncharacterized membrane protein
VRTTLEAKERQRSLLETEGGEMGLMMLLPVVLVILVIWLATTGSAGRDGRWAGDKADAVLRARLAAGEIDAEQYAQARAALGLTEGR